MVNIAKTIPLTQQAIRRLGHRYQRAGLEGALYEKQRPGAAEVLDNNQKQRIIAMGVRLSSETGRPDTGCQSGMVRKLEASGIVPEVA